LSHPNGRCYGPPGRPARPSERGQTDRMSNGLGPTGQ
jgi:hypothetical protein